MNIIDQLRPDPVKPDAQWARETLNAIVRQDTNAEPRRGRRKYLTVGIVAAVVLGGGVATAAAGVFETTYNPHIPASGIVAAQERLDKLADFLQAADSEDQIATIRVDQDSLALTIFLKGKVSGSLAEAIKTADKDIRVKINHVQYSMDDMQAAVRKVQSAVASGEVEMYSVIGPNPDGSGLKIRVSQQVIDQSSKQALVDSYRIAAGMPVTLEIGDPPIPN